MSLSRTEQRSPFPRVSIFIAIANPVTKLSPVPGQETFTLTGEYVGHCKAYLADRLAQFK